MFGVKPSKSVVLCTKRRKFELVGTTLNEIYLTSPKKDKPLVLTIERKLTATRSMNDLLVIPNGYQPHCNVFLFGLGN